MNESECSFSIGSTRSPFGQKPPTNSNHKGKSKSHFLDGVWLHVELEFAFSRTTCCTSNAFRCFLQQANISSIQFSSHFAPQLHCVWGWYWRVNVSMPHCVAHPFNAYLIAFDLTPLVAFATKSVSFIVSYHHHHIIANAIQNKNLPFRRKCIKIRFMFVRRP